MLENRFEKMKARYEYKSSRIFDSVLMIIDSILTVFCTLYGYKRPFESIILAMFCIVIIVMSPYPRDNWAFKIQLALIALMLGTLSVLVWLIFGV